MEAQFKSPLREKHLPRTSVVMVRDISPLLTKRGVVITVIDIFPLLEKGEWLPLLKKRRGDHVHRHHPFSNK